MSDVDISVVIGFKDWGRERVAMAVTSISRAFGDLSGEVIISDYGSIEEGREAFEDLVVSLGGRYVYTPTDGTWSRSRALNAGFAEAHGAVFISTDADMIFTPESLGIVARQILDDDGQAIVLQCRDLPEGFSKDDLVGDSVDWAALERSSRLRPRWGMGGMMACSRAAYLQIRGLDERMEIYGGEDIDFANRLRRSGRRIEWMLDPRVRMYHMWHPPTRPLAVGTEDGARAIERNREIHVSDQSYIRNATRWNHAPSPRELPISVVISTFNRSEYLPDAINSVLAQTMPDFELIIVDDGSTDATRDVVAQFDDPRIRYLHKENGGLAAARNFAADHSRGRFTAIHDDDDIMLPWRLERHLETLTADVNGSYGGWVDFNDETGAINQLQGKALNLGSLLFAGKVYLHPTLMVDTQLLRKIRYDESLRSGSDYNLGLRMLRSGLEFRHTGEFHTLRRLHPRQITATDPSVQKTSAVLSSYMARVPMSLAGADRLRKAWKGVEGVEVRGSVDAIGRVGAYMPDHLVRRSATVFLDPNDAGRDTKRRALLKYGTRYLRVETTDGVVTAESAFCEDVTLGTIAAMRRADLRYELHVQDLGPESDRGHDTRRTGGLGSAISTIAKTLHDEMRGQEGRPYLLLIASEMGVIEEIIGDAPVGLISRVVSDGTTEHHLHVVSAAELAILGRIQSRAERHCKVDTAGVVVATGSIGQEQAVDVLAQSVRANK